MSLKPDDVPQWAWDKAKGCIEAREFLTYPPTNTCARIARAIMAAVEDERAAIEEVALQYAIGSRDTDGRNVGTSIAHAIRNRQSKDG